jgi:hypothetical protein
VAGGGLGPRNARGGRSRRHRRRPPGGGDGEILPVLPESEPARTRTARGLAAALARWALRTGRTSLGWGGVGTTAEHAALAEALRASGFVPWGPGFRLSSTPPPPAPGMVAPLAGGGEDDERGAEEVAMGTDDGPEKA